MSAIFGICHWVGNMVDPVDLEVMGGLLRHRGEGLPREWNAGAVSFGCYSSRLALQPGAIPSPFFWKAAGLAVSADARLDNRDDLLSALDLRGHPAGSVSDGELLLQAYLKWGEACPEKLLGDFAFAIWDERKQQLFAARDHFGVRPFCYHADERLFAFASEPKALLGINGLSQELDEEQIALFLAGMEDSSDTTFFRAVRRLPAGHYLLAQDGAIRTQRYYQLDPERQTRFRRPADCTEAFRSIFTEAVRSRLGSSEGVGCMLSGGLDSSSICCVARELALRVGQGPVRTFSQIYAADSGCDESLYINSVLGLGHFASHLVPAKPVPALEAITEILKEQGQPFVGPGLIANGDLCASARAEGCGILLDGHGGDEVVSRGFGYLRELAQNNRWSRLSLEMIPEMLRNGRAGVSLAASLLSSFGMGARLRQSLAFRKRFARLLPDAPSAASSKSDSPAWCRHLNQDLVARYRLVERRGAWKKQQFLSADTEREAHNQLLASSIHQTAFEELDRSCAARSIEPRYPFWDKRLVEFCLGLPSDQKLFAGQDRVILRRAMKGVLPDLVRRRWSKTNFMPNVQRSLHASKQLAWDNLLEVSSLHLGAFVDLEWMHGIACAVYGGQMIPPEKIFYFISCTVLALWIKGRPESTTNFQKIS